MCTSEAPALDTCAGASAKWGELYGTVCHLQNSTEKTHSHESCGSSTECKDLISSIDDHALAKIRIGSLLCGSVAGSEVIATLAVRAFWLINHISDSCGFPAGTVKATGPGLHTCEGAAVKYTQLWPGTSGAGVCPNREKDDGSGDREHSPATCKTTGCEAAIRSITDEDMACWKDGLQV